MVNIYKPMLTNLQQGILRLLFIRSGTSLNQRRISNILEVSQPAVNKALPRLEKENLIKIEQDKESKRWSIELDRDNQQVIWLKRADNLKQIYESGLAQFLTDNLAGSIIILFGSYAFGEDTDKSDIDLAVFGIKQKNINIEKFEKILERNIIINYYSSFKPIEKYLLNNLLNGITIKGTVEL